MRRGLRGALSGMVLLCAGCASTTAGNLPALPRASGPGASRAQLLGLPVDQQIALERKNASLLVLIVTGNPAASIAATGPRITVAVPQAHACAFNPADQDRVTKQLLRALPFLHHVSFVVAGTGGESLADYLENCISETLTIRVL